MVSNDNKEKVVPNQIPKKELSFDFDSTQNLMGVFALLLKVDKRVNPQNYTVHERKADEKLQAISS